MRLPLAYLVLPHNDGMIERPGVRDDPRDVLANVLIVSDEVACAAVPVYLPCHLFHSLRRRAPEWEGEVQLHPPANVDEGIWYAYLPDELANGEFL